MKDADQAMKYLYHPSITEEEHDRIWRRDEEEEKMRIKFHTPHGGPGGYMPAFDDIMSFEEFSSLHHLDDRPDCIDDKLSAKLDRLRDERKRDAEIFEVRKKARVNVAPDSRWRSIKLGIHLRLIK